MAAKVKIIGVGGGGNNALNTMISSHLTGVEFIAANTDAQALAANLAPMKFQLGASLTKGLGAGANPEVGRKAAPEDVEMIREILKGADMVFITAGLGGGTGTGGAPVIAEVAREMGALTVAIVTKPFHFEGKKRMQQAEEGLANLKMTADALITIPNQRLLSVSGKNMTLLESFTKADEILFHAAKGISDIIVAVKGIARTFQTIRLFRHMTVLENVMVGFHIHMRRGFWGHMLRTPATVKEEEHFMGLAAALLARLGMTDKADTLVENLPYGHQRLVEIGRALGTFPALLFLDEPAAGMNAHEIRELREIILDLKTAGIPVIVVIEHHMDLVMNLCESITVLDFGQKICQGTPSEVQSDPKVCTAYLGQAER